MSESREATLAALRRDPRIEVLIVGGGINGLGTLRDLALQGVDALLVEKGDFCSGASGASSHMIHGGLRYLENGAVRWVREAVRERNLLLRNAPHFVKPLPTTIPIFRTLSGLSNAPLRMLGLSRRPAERGALVIKLGLTLYDRFSRANGDLPPHRFLSRAASLERFPGLSPAIRWTATYHDATVVHPERLALELALDAENEGQRVRVLGYLALEGAGRGAVLLRDGASGETVSVSPRVVVNAAGPWVDAVNDRLGLSTRFIGGTKGSHLVLDHPELGKSLAGHEIFFENQDGRAVLLLPWMGRILAGTSDIRVDGPDDAVCTEEELEYFLAMTRRVFPDLAIRRSHVVFRFSGVRPLAASDLPLTGRIPRDYRIEIREGEELGFPVISLVGGKWTTFRSLAEKTADLVLDRLGKERRRSTRDRAIGGGKDFPRSEMDRDDYLSGLHRQTGVSRARLAALLDRYGTRVEAMAGSLARGEDLPLRELPGYGRGEIAFLAAREKVVHLEDLILRRTPIARRGDLSLRSLEEIAERAGEALGWPRERRTGEIDRSLAALAERHGVELRETASRSDPESSE